MSLEVWLPSGVVPNLWDLSATSEPQDHTHTQYQPSGYGEKLEYSNKSFSPPSSRTDIDRLLGVGMEHITTHSAVHRGMCNYTFTRHQELKCHLKDLGVLLLQ